MCVLQGNHSELCVECRTSYKILNDLYSGMSKNKCLCIDVEDAVSADLNHTLNLKHMPDTSCVQKKFYFIKCFHPDPNPDDILPLSNFLTFSFFLALSPDEHNTTLVEQGLQVLVKA